MTQFSKLMRRRNLLCAAGGAYTIFLPGCGGSVGEDGTGANQPVISVGPLLGVDEGSVTVNGVSFKLGPTTVVLAGFDKPLNVDSLRLGQWVEVTGQIDEASPQGLAERIQVRSSARGQVSAVTTGAGGVSITVLQSVVSAAAGQTVLEGIDDAGALNVGDLVDVHGSLGSAGSVQASRIERLASIDSHELRGQVSGLNAIARRAVIGNQPVNFSQATQTLREAIANGQVLRVAAALPPVAGQEWMVERIASDTPVRANLAFAYAEGLTSRWRAGPLFDLDGLPVDGRNAANRAVVNADDLRVAAIGSMVDGVLQAKSLGIVRPGQAVVFNLTGAITAFVSPAEFRVRNVLVDARSATYSGGVAGDLANGRKVRVSGNLVGQRLRASRVEFVPS
jgi:Domain of unknown function (DUF5666)